MPRVKLFNQESAKEKALKLFWEKGYESTSLSNLTSTLNIGKGSFYDTFKSKKDLFLSCVEMYQNMGFRKLEMLLSEKSDPTEAIRFMIDSHTEAMLYNDEAKGCLLSNSTIETSDNGITIELLEKHNQELKQKFVTHLNKGSYKKDVGVLADAIILHTTGISVMSKFIRDPERFKPLNDLFMESIY